MGELRQRKDEQELVSIRKAIRRATESFQELKKYIRPGARERGLAFMLEFLMREKGARKAAFDTIVASGRNGAMPHASVTDRRIKKGDLVTFDFGAEADGYFCDITRTLCVGRPSARQREIHALVLLAQTAAIKSVYPGVSCKTVDDAARDTIKKAGHGRHFGHGTGHGIGLMVHEGPSLSPLIPRSCGTGYGIYHRAGCLYPRLGRRPDRRYGAGDGERREGIDYAPERIGEFEEHVAFRGLKE